jgi:hypothetical protein
VRVFVIVGVLFSKTLHTSAAAFPEVQITGTVQACSYYEFTSKEQ